MAIKLLTRIQDDQKQRRASAARGYSTSMGAPKGFRSAELVATPVENQDCIVSRVHRPTVWKNARA
ncbi:MAG: hypothetical protein DI630_09380 [Gordonia sp. (in: high G+C Gram-positive bacteria)]|nr:MAG: hypothetical protein DI630_09380 [Gordonia sp. (in: high G+C Gram-positive bacteria)]